MAFPVSPVNNQIYNDGTYTYRYNSTFRTWTKVAQTLSNVGNVVTQSGNVVSGNTSLTASNVVVGNTSITTSNVVVGNTTISSSNITLGNTVVSTSNGSAAYWSTKYYYGDTPPDFATLNYGDIFFYVDNPNGFQRLYMWVTDGSSDYFYDFLPPSFWG